MTSGTQETHDKAGEAYWSGIWAAGERPRPVNLAERGFRNHFRLSLHKKFREVFAGLPTHEMELLEVGCGNSIWLPYFAKEFGFRVSGIDYSEEGCRTSREMLDAAGVQGTIRYADVFARPEDMRHRYDVILSVGVVEHFQDPSMCLAAFRDYLKPNGLVLTLVPNFAGIVGDLAKLLNPYLYSIHVPLDRQALQEAHERAGFKVSRAEYFLGLNLAVVNLGGAPADKLAGLRRAAVSVCRGVTAGVWKCEQLIHPLPPTRYFSPYVLCVAQG